MDHFSKMGLSLAELRDGLPAGGLFGGGSWKWSPEPLKLSAAEARSLMQLGHPLAQFQQSSDSIYRLSAAGKLPPWIADLLDRGKPDWLVKIQRQSTTAGHLPRVIRPDLILTPEGFALTELDSVPGGIGLTAWLARIYSKAGFKVLGGPNGMLDGFRSLNPSGTTVLISEEAADYRPEMEWLTHQLGPNWNVRSAETYQPDGHPLYRFFELFDWQSIPCVRELAEQASSGTIQITPAFTAHLEEKLWLALLWAPSLQNIWRQALRGNHLKRLHELVPFSWMLDPTPLPPHAALPRLNVHCWEDVAHFSQKNRQLALKISGFNPQAWGSRGVFIGHDLATAAWAEKIHSALEQAPTHPWMLQEFREGRRVTHPVFRDDGSVEMIDGRVRLCPYFFTDEANVTTFAACLATIAPLDKKKIHGMTDAILVPCIIA